MCDSGILIEMNAMNAILLNRHYSEQSFFKLKDQEEKIEWNRYYM